jgi:hypothetical protein
VVRTLPLDADEDVEVDATIEVEFNETVTLADDWLDVDCSDSGVHPGSTTVVDDVVGVFDPDDDFVAGEECTVIVRAAGVTDADGLTPVADVEFFFATVDPTVDVVAPAVTVAHTPGGAAGWDRTAPVAVAVTAADNVGLAALSCTVDGVATALVPTFAAGAVAYLGVVIVAGEGQHAVACTAADAAGNVATGPDLAETVAIDTRAPRTTVTGVADGTVVAIGDPEPVAGCATTDPAPGSGVATAATVAVDRSQLSALGVGPVTVTCAGAVDVAGNAEVSASVRYRIGYADVTGILAPVASDSTGLVTRGRSVPVKFQLGGDEPAGVPTDGWVLERIRVPCTAPYAPPPTGQQMAPSRGGIRYDVESDTYVTHADFRSDPTGTCWRVRVVLDAGEATAWSGAFRPAR